MKNIYFVNSHPIQYFTPWYKYLNKKGLRTIAWYCSDESLDIGIDKEFGVKIKWDIPLLDGYDYEFFKNYSLNPSHFNGFFGLVNLGMIWRLLRIPKSVIVVHGWHYFTNFVLLMLGNLIGHTVCVRCDIPLKQERLKHGIKQSIKKIGLKFILFPRIDFFLYIGEQNRLFYKSFGIDNNRLLSCPYAVDNERFTTEYMELVDKIPALKKNLGIKVSDKVILFSGKYIDKKRPLDLLHAFIKINAIDCWLIMVGEGGLRFDLEKIISDNRVKNVILTGFINQTEISQYYAISDVFVMCSYLGENWGLSVNEAMNFNLPLIISDFTGCLDDLVIEGENGYCFKTGDIEDLAEKLNSVLYDGQLDLKSSRAILNQYSYSASLPILKGLAE